MVIATDLSLDTCNFNCEYCYQTPEKLVETHPRNYDLEKVLGKMEELYEKHGSSLGLHSGEPTALHRDDLEKLLKKQYELTDKSSMQTNGYRIDEYFDLFKKYNTNLGISFDGPGECNILRGFGDREKRLEIAEKVEENIYKAKEQGIDVSMISVIHRKNGVDNFDKFKEFLIESELSGRLNPVSITDNIGHSGYELTIDELKDVYDKLYKVCRENGLEYTPFKDMSWSLREKNNVVCTFNDSCDIYCTEAFTGITGNGKEINCAKTYHDDVIYPRADNARADIREAVLKETDCKNCKWFEYCKGGCPNNGIDEDWRRKDKYCPLYKHLFEKISNTLNSLGIDIHTDDAHNAHNEPCDEKCEHKNDGDYTDDIRHEDGSTVHLDSDIGMGMGKGDNK